MRAFPVPGCDYRALSTGTVNLLFMCLQVLTVTTIKMILFARLVLEHRVYSQWNCVLDRTALPQHALRLEITT